MSTNAERRLAELRRLTELQHKAEANETRAAQAHRDAKRRADEAREAVHQWLKRDAEPCPLFDHLEGKEDTQEPAAAPAASEALAPDWSHGCAFPVRLEAGQVVNVCWNPARGWLVMDGLAIGQQRRIEVVPDDKTIPLIERAREWAEHIAGQARKKKGKAASADE